ncbi:MAG: RagB/SusD family nutrient uptake outer membrane protein [Sphingobacterium hotanense]
MKFTRVNSIKKYCVAACCAMLMIQSSCDSFLDVRPVGELPSDKLLEKPEGFESALYGAYASLRADNLYGKTLSHEMIEVLAQYFECPSNEYVDQVKVYNYKHTLLETATNNVWKNMYTNISNVNNILESLAKKDAGSMRYYNLYKGEALGLRAFMHFELLRLFTEDIKLNAAASGIPYVKTFSQQSTPFSTAAAVYDAIITDLKDAEALLAEDQNYFTYPKANPAEPFIKDRDIHFNLYAVQAILARVYLTKGDLDNAANYAKKVIDSQKFELLDKTEIAEAKIRGILFPKEAIFGLYSDLYYTTVYERLYQEITRFSYNLRKDIRNIYSLEEKGHDYRWEGYIKMPTMSGGNYRFVKLVDPFQVNDIAFQRPANAITGINMIRLPEMYYIMAEALLSKNPTEAQTYFDAVLKSRGLEGLSERDPALQLTQERIDAERYKEFIGEGQTFFNMKRRNLDIMSTINVKIPASNAIYVWPIPDAEKEFNN